MKSLNLLFLIAAISLVLSCQKGAVGIEEPDVTPPVEEPKDTTVNREPVPDALPIELRLADKVETDNAFSLDLFKHTLARSKEPNVFLSPLSVSMALSMTLNGAVGKTAEEMLTALRAEGYTIDEINEYCRELREALVNVDPLTELAIANSIWYRDKGFSVKEPFIDANKAFFNAEVNALDFTSPNAVKEINGWCALQTKDRIQSIIDKINDPSMMYLINAVYFKGGWVSHFKEADTKEETFNAEGGIKETVQMMKQTASFAYATDADAAWLALPYGNKAFEMILILPHSETTDTIAARLNNELWRETIERLSMTEVQLHLPRFKAECNYGLEEGILPAMGMTIPFSEAADFSGISDIPLFISRVIHKTFVEVNEEGTEAAAVTAVGMSGTFFPDRVPVTPPVFYVNKPFIFAIRERSTGAILFIGKMGEINKKTS